MVLGVGSRLFFRDPTCRVRRLGCSSFPSSAVCSMEGPRVRQAWGRGSSGRRWDVVQLVYNVVDYSYSCAVHGILTAAGADMFVEQYFGYFHCES